jgi:hypothetical protein
MRALRNVLEMELQELSRRIWNLLTTLSLSARDPELLRTARELLEWAYREAHKNPETFRGVDADTFAEEWSTRMSPIKLGLRKDLNRSSLSLGAATHLSWRWIFKRSRTWKYFVKHLAILRPTRCNPNVNEIPGPFSHYLLTCGAKIVDLDDQVLSSGDLQSRFERSKQLLKGCFAAHVHLERMLDAFHQLLSNIPVQDDRDFAHRFTPATATRCPGIKDSSGLGQRRDGKRKPLDRRRRCLGTSIPPQRPPGLVDLEVAGRPCFPRCGDRFTHPAELPYTGGPVGPSEVIPLAFDPAWIRKEYNLSTIISDQDIREAADFLLNRATKDLNIVMGNYLEWRELCKQYRISVNPMWIPVFSLDSFSGRYFGETVFLFVDAHYGPVLAWARVTLERLLQEESMRFPDLKRQIEVEGRNPSIGKMSETLASADQWTADEKKAVTSIETNGDWTVHHRIDQFAKGKVPTDYRLGVARVTIGIGGMKKLGDDLPATVEQNLNTEYRKRGIESLRALCILFQRYRPPGPES